MRKKIPQALKNHEMIKILQLDYIQIIKLEPKGAISPQGLPKQNYSYPKNVFQTFFQLNNVWLVRRFR